MKSSFAAKNAIALVTIGTLVALAPGCTPNPYSLDDVDTPTGDSTPIDVSAADAFGPSDIMDIPQGSAEPDVEPDLIDQNLARLAALEVFEVGYLLVDAPEGAFNCYGPCPEFADEIAAAEAEAAERLADLVEVAEAAATSPPAAYACDESLVSANLDALRSLQIITVGNLVQAVPENAAACYGLPCPDDVLAAEQLTCERAGVLSNIAADAEQL